MADDHGVALMHRTATDAAGACRAIVLKTAMQIQGRKYVRVEGWQAIANAFGCVSSSLNVERIEGGVRATGQVRRISDGTVIAEAEGFVGDDETKTWADRYEYAKRAMAQTRAISRACRSAFAFVVTLMDAGLETTPAEEVTEGFGIPRQSASPAPRTLTREVLVPVRPTPAAAKKRAEDEDMIAARRAINAAKTVDALERHKQTILDRTDSGFYTSEQSNDLLDQIDIKIDWIANPGPDDVEEFSTEGSR